MTLCCANAVSACALGRRSTESLAGDALLLATTMLLTLALALAPVLLALLLLELLQLVPAILPMRKLATGPARIISAPPPRAALPADEGMVSGAGDRRPV